MASADLIDIPANLNEMASPVQQKRKVEEESVAASKKKPATSISRISTLQARMRELPNWFPTAKNTTWTNVTRPGKSQRTLFVLTAEDGSQQFCMVGRIFNAMLSEQKLSEPSQFNEGNENNTDLSVHFTMRPADVDGWSSFTEDAQGSIDQIAAIRQSAIEDAMVPLIKGDDEKVLGLTGKKLDTLRKKSAEKLAEMHPEKLVTPPPAPDATCSP